jgi:nucleotide-binding universal stress UspA family protein
MFKSVLVATDGSQTAAEAVRVAIELGTIFEATLHVVNIYRPSAATTLAVAPVTIPAEVVELGEDARTHVESVATLARQKGLAAKSHVASGDPANQIVGIAKDHGVDLIVVGNRGMRGLKRVLGSVPNAVAHRAPCAVLIVNTT